MPAQLYPAADVCRHELKLWEIVRMPSIHSMAAVDAPSPSPSEWPASQVGPAAKHDQAHLLLLLHHCKSCNRLVE